MFLTYANAVCYTILAPTSSLLSLRLKNIAGWKKERKKEKKKKKKHVAASNTNDWTISKKFSLHLGSWIFLRVLNTWSSIPRWYNFTYSKGYQRVYWHTTFFRISPSSSLFLYLSQRRSAYLASLQGCVHLSEATWHIFSNLFKSCEKYPSPGTEWPATDENIFTPGSFFSELSKSLISFFLSFFFFYRIAWFTEKYVRSFGRRVRPWGDTDVQKFAG